MGNRRRDHALRIDGAVTAPRSFSLSDLRALPSRDVTTVLAGADGEGAVEATWTGVPLATLLDLAAPVFGAVDVASIGAGGQQYSFGLPLTVARHALVAWACDDEVLTPARGGPLRLIVPGWPSDVTTTSLAALTVTDRVVATGGWSVADALAGRCRPVGPLLVTSRILTQTPLAAGWVEIAGVAWSGNGAVTGVEVGTDGGRRWRQAKIVAPHGRWGFTRFTARCRVARGLAPGVVTVCSRATDAVGMTQPRIGTTPNAVRPVTLAVR